MGRGTLDMASRDSARQPSGPGAWGHTVLGVSLASHRAGAGGLPTLSVKPGEVVCPALGWASVVGAAGWVGGTPREC